MEFSVDVPINFVFVQIPWSLGILFDQRLIHLLGTKCWHLREVLLQSSNKQTLNRTKQETWKPRSQANLGSRPHSSLALFSWIDLYPAPWLSLQSLNCSLSKQRLMLQISGSPTVGPKPAASTSPENWLEMKVLGPHPNQKFWGWDPVTCALPSPPGDSVAHTKVWESLFHATHSLFSSLECTLFPPIHLDSSLC